MNPWIELKLYYMFDNLYAAHRPVINFYWPIFNVKSLLTYSLHIFTTYESFSITYFLVHWKRLVCIYNGNGYILMFIFSNVCWYRVNKRAYVNFNRKRILALDIQWHLFVSLSTSPTITRGSSMMTTPTTMMLLIIISDGASFYLRVGKNDKQCTVSI